MSDPQLADVARFCNRYYFAVLQSCQLSLYATSHQFTVHTVLPWPTVKFGVDMTKASRKEMLSRRQTLLPPAVSQQDSRNAACSHKQQSYGFQQAKRLQGSRLNPSLALTGTRTSRWSTRSRAAGAAFCYIWHSEMAQSQVPDPVLLTARYPDIEMEHEIAGGGAAAPGDSVTVEVSLQRALEGDLTPVDAAR